MPARRRISEAVALLAARDGDAKALAGGQSLVPMLAFRLAQPSLLVDLRKLAELREIKISDDGVSARRHGALARHRGRRAARHRASAAQGRDRARRALPDPQSRHGRRQHRACRSGRRDARHRGDLRRRDRGGRQGRRAHHQGGRFLPGRRSRRRSRADEIIIEIRLPAWPARRRWGFQEFARRRGDFAMAGSRALLRSGRRAARARNAHVGVIGVGDRPQRLAAVEAALNGQVVDEATIAQGRRGRHRPRSSRRTTFTPAPPTAGADSAPWSNARCKARRRADDVTVSAHAGSLRSQRQAGQRRGRAAPDARRLPAPSSCGSPARMSAASMASAAPARCWSTARRCAPA